MAAAVVRRTDTGCVLRVEVPQRDSMLDAGEAILAALNQAGRRQDDRAGPKTHRLYLPTATPEPAPAPEPGKAAPKGRKRMVPGSFVVVVVGE